MSLALLYLMPVMAVAWSSGRRTGLIVAAAAGFSGLLAALVDGGAVPLGISAWNAVVRTSIFAVVVWLVDLERRLLTEQYVAASLDPMTGTMNLRTFREVAARQLRWAVKYSQPVSLLYVDLDGVKATNEQFGRRAGDEMVEYFAEVARRVMGADDVLARVGGDEFALMLPGAGVEDAVEVAERLAVALLEDPTGPALSTSIGVATRYDATEDVDALITDADEAMFEAKRSGGASVHLHLDADLWLSFRDTKESYDNDRHWRHN